LFAQLGVERREKDKSGAAVVGTQAPIERSGSGELLDLDNVADTVLARIVDKRKSIRFEKNKKGKKKGEKKEKKAKEKKEKKESPVKNSRFSKANKKNKKKLDATMLAVDLPAQGLLVKDPVGALPIREVPAAAPARKRKPAVPPPMFGSEDPETGHVLRDIFYWDAVTSEEGVIAHAFSEPPGTAVDNWAKLGLPVRVDIAEFILEEFGGCQDTNTLSSSNLESMEGWLPGDVDADAAAAAAAAAAPPPPAADY
jgi:hypothetical protein